MSGAGADGTTVLGPLWNKEFNQAFLHLIKYVDPDTGDHKNVEIFVKLAPIWRKVAMRIGLDEAEILAIENAGAGTTPEMCLMKVIGRWENNAVNMNDYARYPETWRGMYNLLDDSGQGILAKKLQTALDADYSTLRKNYSEDLVVRGRVAKPPQVAKPPKGLKFRGREYHDRGSSAPVAPRTVERPGPRPSLATIVLCLLVLGLAGGAIVYFCYEASHIPNGETPPPSDKPGPVPRSPSKTDVKPIPSVGDRPADAQREDASAGVCHQIEESDVDTVYNYLHNNIGDWEMLCKRLGLPQGAINNIQSSTTDKLYGCLVQLSKLGPPHSCWEKVAAVVCGPPFHNWRLGSGIVRDKNLVMPSECKP